MLLKLFFFIGFLNYHKDGSAVIFPFTDRNTKYRKLSVSTLFHSNKLVISFG